MTRRVSGRTYRSIREVAKQLAEKLPRFFHVKAKRTEEYREKFANPFVAASRGYIDDVIFPRNTRMHLIRTLQMLDSKRTKGPDRKHGNIPL